MRHRKDANGTTKFIPAKARRRRSTSLPVSGHPLHKIKTVLTNGKIEFENGNRVNYDLLIGIPPHKVPGVIRNSGLIIQGQNWINVDKFTLKTDYDNVFAIGDVTEIKVNENMAIPKDWNICRSPGQGC